MLVYKRLWTVERTFRTTKDCSRRGRSITNWMSDPRPRRLQLPRPRSEEGVGRPPRRARAPVSWPDVIADLDSLTETKVEQDGKRFLPRSAPRPAATLALSALGVALPPTLRQIADA